jgi:hypothetical protein
MCAHVLFLCDVCQFAAPQGTCVYASCDVAATVVTFGGCTFACTGLLQSSVRVGGRSTMMNCCGDFMQQVHMVSVVVLLPTMAVEFCLLPQSGGPTVRE